ncbi:MAG: hypothetical protein H6719_09690 [Sandaracinaceae bacterium]|nr:hypothetical protein [Sandaracinaceae bacterium]
MRIAIVGLAILALLGCDEGGAPDASTAPYDGDFMRRDAGVLPPTEPVPLNASDFTYTLEESSATLPLWTTPVTRRVTVADRAPTATRSGLWMSAARGEMEAAQLLLGPVAGRVSARVAPFADLPGARIEVSVAGYVAGVEETLTPLASGVDLADDRAVPLWIVVTVPRDASPGDHATTVSVTLAGGTAVEVPLTLHVYDFAIPEDIHFQTQLNLDVGSLASGRTVDEAKTLLFEHRFTPKSVTWPSGFTPSITWDSDANPMRCRAFWDEPTEADEYSIGALSRRYVLGEGWNGRGFPTAMIFQFVDNATPRPDTFCGESRGDAFGTDAYDREWSAFLSALDAYLVDASMQERAYYYVQNEPQDAEDARLAAHLCRLTRAAAPNLRIAISEEPTPAIAEDPGGACGYDIWIAHVRAYEEGYAWARQRDHGEQVWFYSLDHDPPPYFNPTGDDAPGLHARIIPWAAWSHRIRGWAYYDFDRFFHGGLPGVRAELFREGFEDYEYLFLANGSQHPEVDLDAAPDRTVRSVASSMTSFTQDPDALMALRHELARYLEGSRDTLPVLEVEGGRPRAAYFLNFQDPSGEPSAEPLVIGGDEYLKVGWEPWDDAAGLGWMGENVGTGIVMSGYDDVGGFDERQRSYVYDDYGRNNLFEFAIAPGRYSVTVGVGRPARGYPGDPHNVRVEGVVAVNDEATSDAAPTIERTVTVETTDGRLSFEVGGRSASSGDWAYTFLAYVTITPVD